MDILQQQNRLYIMEQPERLSRFEHFQPGQRSSSPRILKAITTAVLPARYVTTLMP